MNMKLRLIVMNFLQFAVWGAYLTSMGTYLAGVGLGGHIGIFYAMQGIVSLFMPAVLGIIADRWVPAQRLLGLSHLLAALFMGGAGYYAMTTGPQVEFAPLFSFYSVSVAFYMPTLALSNSVAYAALDKAGLDTIKAFPPIRTFGTIGFICSMWLVDLLGFQSNYMQFFTCAAWGVVLAIYAQTLPECPVSRAQGGRKSLVEALGLKAFLLFKNRKMAVFFIFSMLLGAALQITNAFGDSYIQNFGTMPQYADSPIVRHSVILLSLSQMSETFCILLIPFFLRRFGIKWVMLISMLAWVLRFGFFGIGNPGSGAVFLILSMIVYGVAFDFFNISGSLFVEKETTPDIRSSAQGVFMIMTNGLGAFFGSYAAGAVVDAFGWPESWYIFAGYALVVAIVFAMVFRYKHKPEEMGAVSH